MDIDDRLSQERTIAGEELKEVSVTQLLPRCRKIRTALPLFSRSFSREGGSRSPHYLGERLCTRWSRNHRVRGMRCWEAIGQTV